MENLEDGLTLDLILGLEDLPKCLSFGCYSGLSRYGCFTYVQQKKNKECIYCKYVTENFPNLWKPFSDARQERIRAKKAGKY